jgi:PD-(D/E)XK nuclease superfamily
MGGIVRQFASKRESVRGGFVTYSYTQISHYLTCPRRYRHRYLDGWQEKDTRAAMLFGRAFERALAAYFLREDGAAVLFREWAAHQNPGLQFKKGDTWDRMLQQGIQLLDRFCQDDRILIHQPRRNLQTKFTRPVSEKDDFVAYVDAIGNVDDTRCLIEWKTTGSRYPEKPDGLLALDPQLVCYSWITGISEVAQVVFVRKRLVEVQYLRTTITDQQRGEFGQLVQDTIGRIESAQFLPHSGIRFPQNPCSSCPYIGLCLGNPGMVESDLVRRPGAEKLGWLDELSY